MGMSFLLWITPCSAEMLCRFYEHTKAEGKSFEIDRQISVNRLDHDWNDIISSVWVKNGYRVILYEHTDYEGRKLVLEGNRSGRGMLFDLVQLNFNDIVSSFAVENIKSRISSRLCCKFYEHVNGEGRMMEVEPGDAVSRLTGGWNDIVSSVWVNGGCQVTIFEHFDYGGRQHALRGNQSTGGTLFNLTDIHFNDIVSSYQAGESSPPTPLPKRPNTEPYRRPGKPVRQ